MRRFFLAAFVAGGVVFAACTGSDPDVVAEAKEDAGFDAVPVADSSIEPDDAKDVQVATDAPAEAAVGDGGCTADMPFVTITSAGALVNLPGINDTAPRLTPDELVMWTTRWNPSPYLVEWVRATLDEPWEYRGTAYNDYIERREAWVSPDRQRLYDSQVTGGRYKALRANLDSDGGLVTYAYIPALTGNSDEVFLYFVPDESELWVIRIAPETSRFFTRFVSRTAAIRSPQRSTSSTRRRTNSASSSRPIARRSISAVRAGGRAERRFTWRRATT